ncbi:phosphatidylglycerophosphate phosphatase PTPMT2 isoform X1 [Hevea brasiliensis]|uniref:phosphatidylglycerophosphate phosphatase PTPMT2 isoform X1 n=1 Tax=Hevea brasiliensis TaxID=3981 RepID=UPI0025D96BA2|nr:phosphatidylglycerophosphate phosphatase PTPMT2 isoform X1 [Hevea brasiliensis]
MYIEELKEGEVDVRSVDDKLRDDMDGSCSDAKRVLVGAGARALFYPTLLYNVLRNKIQSEFRWWDRVDEFILLGAVPFPTDVPRLKELGVSGVVTLNEPYETLVPTSLYHWLYGFQTNCVLKEPMVVVAASICHIPLSYFFYHKHTKTDICRAVNFIHENASQGKTTYVHCKAGRGRSTTIVLCYLVQHRHMTPDTAYEYVRSIRSRVLLASSQWQAVQDYYLLKVKETGSIIARKSIDFLIREEAKQGTEASDDSTFVVVTDSDLDGYDVGCETVVVNDKMLGELSLACRVQFASQAAMSRISCLWLGCIANHKPSNKKHGSSLCNDQLRSLTVDIRVY